MQEKMKFFRLWVTGYGLWGQKSDPEGSLSDARRLSLAGAQRRTLRRRLARGKR